MVWTKMGKEVWMRSLVQGMRYRPVIRRKRKGEPPLLIPLLLPRQ
ncbi:hypothetical protein ID866_11181 [Astraeus odoratus]|nr:hypothetical protein ID866_11181 [Astraeus odoratus]